ncbi:glycosyl hydrolase 53 family protein [Winogradskyella aquimaris]|uniref:Arabinogalactan endo-beta-1,4-galactanase n=1 Tax=Winogradskyella aquimaris TaxID=864074 RepID=A0ABU5EK32_9FLAO|nr:glycosyl hydrolase 53 family protein [Winogradskyella aquimaris]MDY2586734.1 glycosyl hydrolase 53 family protein [Winogradskyella aquimaris]
MNHNICLSLLILLVFSSCTDKAKEATNVTELPVKDYKSWYQVETGRPNALIFASYKTTMIANGKDQSLLRISTVDSIGMEIKDASLPFEISVKGDATIIDIDSSEIEPVLESDTLSIWKSNINNGVKQLWLRAGNTTDKITVKVSTDSFWPASHEIHTIPADIKLLQPTKEQITPGPKIEPEMLGADISFLPQLEARGAKFHDDGLEKDVIEILKDHGFNYIRLRVFVNPENEQGYSPNKGFCGLDYTLQMAKRIKDAGLNLLLDFHYSDTWADPQKQFKPKAWEGLTFNELTSTLKEYTKSVLTQLKDQGTMPDMVQIGNEVNHGIVWPEGHVSNLDNLAALLKAGTEAVREVDANTSVMMHLALGGQNEETTFWFDNMIARGVDFDIIGLSYYPIWHCTLDDLNHNMLDLIQRYQKDVNVVEYSAFKKAVNDMVFNLPNDRGNGTCIWEPLNTWSKVFDENGQPLKELDYYDEIQKEFLE